MKRRRIFKFYSFKLWNSICILLLTTIMRANWHSFQIFLNLTLRDRQSNRECQCKSQTIFESLRQLQLEWLIRLFFDNEIRKQFCKMQDCEDVKDCFVNYRRSFSLYTDNYIQERNFLRFCFTDFLLYQSTDTSIKFDDLTSRCVSLLTICFNQIKRQRFDVNHIHTFLISYLISMLTM